MLNDHTARVVDLFRPSLGIAQGQLAILRRETENGLATTDGTLRRLTVASGAVQRLAGMFDRWLQSDRLRRGIKTLAKEEIRLLPWLENLCDEVAHRFAEHPLEFRVPEGAKLHADPHLLELAVTNLLENAAKYSSPGAPIVVECRFRSREIGLAVMDRGSGVAPELQGRVFSDFVRGRAEGPISGLGLGLSIVRRIVEAHGGHVELDSQVGAGSDFCLWLPYSGAEGR